MSNITVHVLHTGSVCVAPALAFGGLGTNAVGASGVFESKEDRIWLPVSVYYIESPHGKILVDTGWHRDMSPDGIFDKKAQIKSLGNIALYETNQGALPKGEAVNEQLAAMGVNPRDIDLVLLTHLDCDHANGLKLVEDAKKILVSDAELRFARKKSPMDMIRYNKNWWEGTKIEGFDWNKKEGPFGRAFDVFGDGSFMMIHIPGHSEGLCALKIQNDEGKFVLLFADGGYAKLSWQVLLPSGIASNRKEQIQSLKWIREMSLDPDCIASLATHDPDVTPRVIKM